MTPQADPEPWGPTSSIAYEFYDFFNVPFREWWDIRLGLYADYPMNAECFSQAGMDHGLCTPDPTNAVPDVATYPYTNWYPFILGSTDPARTTSIPFIYAPYRMGAVGSSVPGYTLTEPVYLPILKPQELAGGTLELDWQMEYLDTTTYDALRAEGCSLSRNDGYFVRSQITVTMDLQESKRLFGVAGTSPDAARSWWAGAIDPDCGVLGTVEAAWQDAIQTLGGKQLTPGKYDIYNGYEYFYSPFYTQMTATVDAAGITRVTIDHSAWGTEVLMARFLYWGAASYLTNYLDSRQAAGWLGMEYPWFEDFAFHATFGTADHAFRLTTAIYYHLQQNSDPGPDGLYNRVGDIPYWTWGSWLADYLNDYSPKHLVSEMDRYAGADGFSGSADDPTYVYTTPGSFSYGRDRPFDYLPATWNLRGGESWTFRFPTGDVVFFDPATPAGAHPRKGEYLEIRKPLGLMRTVPDEYGDWDPLTATWTVTGPSDTGGPLGWAGGDGQVGTADDQYPLLPWGGIDLWPAEPIPISVGLAAPWPQLAVGQTMVITLTAMAGEAPLPDASVSATSVGGTATPSSGTTDAAGGFRMTFTPDLVATDTMARVSTTVSKSGLGPGTASLDILVKAEPDTATLTASSNRVEMMGLEVATLTLNLRDLAGAGLEGAVITATSTGGSFGPPTGLGGGVYTIGWTAPVLTRQSYLSIALTARVGGYTDSRGRVTILVDPNMTNPPDPTPLLVLGLPDKTTLRPGETIGVRVYVYTPQGYVVSGAGLAITVFPTTTGTVSAVQDRLNGLYTFTFTAASVTGTVTVSLRLIASKFGYANSLTARITLTISP